jgi:KaiC
VNDRVPIRQPPSGVPGLGEVFGGGIPEFSFSLVAGGPGCGKTTLGHQIMFANASPERKAVYFSVIGDGRAGRLVRGSPIEPSGHRVSDGRHHHPALHQIDGELRRAMAVVKLRASQELREYDITSAGGIVVAKALKGYQGLLTGTLAVGGKKRRS